MKKTLLVSLLAATACWFGSAEAYALDQKDGVYQIGTAQDLVDFSNVVASGTGNANAVLTADIDMSGVDNYLPIGSVSSPYKGTFDGQEHYIRSLVIDLPEQEYVGLFGVLNNGAYIKNVIIDDMSSVSGLRFVGGIAGGTNGGGKVTFENCGNEGFVGAAEVNAAGILGVSMLSQCSVIMTNCFNTGGITGANESAALCGWCGDNGSVITNCYNAGFVIGMDGSYSLYRNTRAKAVNCYDSYGNQGTQISDDEYDLSSGTITYQMNGNQSANVTWYQTLGEDLHPVPFKSHGVVYAVGDLYCDGSSKGGELTFSNENTSNRDPHEFVDGICSVCGDVDTEYLPLTDGYYTLTTAKELNWFAELVNRGHKKVNARLGADIDFSEYTKLDVMIGGNAFSDAEEEGPSTFEGTFDGQGHKITVNYAASYDGVALFKVVANSTIKNLVVDGNIETTGRFMGGLGFVSRGTSTYENIIVSVNMTSSFEGDGTHGGIFAVCHESASVRNCAFIGSIDAPLSEGSAGTVGYAHDKVQTTIRNCYVAPKVFALTGNSTVFGRNINTRMNCYYTDIIVEQYDDAAEVISEDMLATGELTYKLNDANADGAWRQTLGQDAYPVPFADHAKVYANGSLNCDGTAGTDISYSNTQGQPVRDAHQYSNDICSVCGARIIRNAQQLVAVAEAINNEEIDGNVIIDLDADIDMAGVTGFTGIGARYNKPTGETNEEGNPIVRDVKASYKGTFDGHGHRISNMVIESTEGNVGLFGLVSGATIKNVVVGQTCEIYAQGWAGGIAGTACDHKPLTIENCGFEGIISVEGPNAAGILGVNDGSEATVSIVNCYNAGTVIGGRESAAISGWLGDVAEVTNCYNSGVVAGYDNATRTFARYNADGAKFTNCYEIAIEETTQVTGVSTDQIESGELCYLLNQGAGKTVFYQKLGEDFFPVLDATRGFVAKDGDAYINVETDGVASARTVAPAESAVFNLRGVRQQQLQRGINIVRKADGTVRKVLVK